MIIGINPVLEASSSTNKSNMTVLPAFHYINDSLERQLGIFNPYIHAYMLCVDISYGR